ncbi:MAG: aspartate carbamoyltransferase, partial [Oscillospiraceae bacterium]
EPSTRTQMSFQTAMMRLGGKTIGFDNPQNSSVSKGESLTDTIRVVSDYADIIAMRHPREGSAKAACLYSGCPIINAGDGGHLHPTQTLTDLVTLKMEKGRLNNLTIGFCGDLRNGRTVHSLIKALSHYDNNKFVLVSTQKLSLPKYIKEYLNTLNCEYTEVLSLDEAIKSLDILYMTRIQKERFSSEEEYLSQKNVYILDTVKLEKGKSDLIIMHPLPRVDEIETDVDDDPRAKYFKQAGYGVYARMALILTLLTKHQEIEAEKYFPSNTFCENPNCITNHEIYLKKLLKTDGEVVRCAYCQKKQ